MKPISKKMLEATLRWMAIVVLKKHKPIIIGITGSVGKSSTKEAIAIALGSKFSVRKSKENYNNEIGVPLTIIGAKSGKRSIFGWLNVVRVWFKTVLFSFSYPEVLVLELGIDRPGDMKYLMSFIPVQIGVVTNVSSSHLEFFKSVSKIAQEKGILIKSLPETGTAILCADNDYVMKLSQKTKAQVITFGMSDVAMIRADHVTFLGDTDNFTGCNFKLSYDGKSIPVQLSSVVAKHHINAVLASFAVGIALKINPVDIAVSMRSFQSLPGRMKLIQGINQSWVIDDTYNASPVSLQAALKTIHSLESGRRVAILGDMLELGVDSEQAHQSVAQWIVEYSVDTVIFVGKNMLFAYELLEQKGFSKEKMFWFSQSMDAKEKSREIVGKRDIVLVKGSQGMRMEKVTEALMAHPEHARKLLCRQSPDWLSR